MAEACLVCSIPRPHFAGKEAELWQGKCLLEFSCAIKAMLEPEPLPWLLAQDRVSSPRAVAGRNSSCRTRDLCVAFPWRLSRLWGSIFLVKAEAVPTHHLATTHGHNTWPLDFPVTCAAVGRGCGGELTCQKPAAFSWSRCVREFSELGGLCWRRPVGSRESENIMLLPSVSFHLS